MVGLDAPAQRLAERGGADRHQHELLEVDGVVGVGAAVQHVQHRNGQHVGVGAADGAVERDLEVVRHRLGAGQRDGQHRVGAEPTLVGRPVEVDHGVVDGPLIERVEPADRVGDLTVDVGHGAQHTLAREAVSPVAQLDRFTDARRGTRWCDGTTSGTGVEQHLRLDGRVAAGVEDLAPDHVLNGAHDITPWVPSLAGHRATRLAVAHLVVGDAFGREDLARARTVPGHARPVPRRRRDAAPGSPR